MWQFWSTLPTFGEKKGYATEIESQRSISRSYGIDEANASLIYRDLRFAGLA
jgi:hypothetical protein